MRKRRYRRFGNKGRNRNHCRLCFWLQVRRFFCQFAKQFTGNNEALTKAGAVIQQLINDGEFNYKSLDDNERSGHLDTVFAAAGNSVHSNGAVSAAGDFYKWWLSFVIPNNRYGLPETKQQQLIQALKPQNIGATEDDFKRDYGDIGVYLYNSADYFLYLWIPAAKEARLPYFLKKKIRKQQEIYRYVSQVFTALYGGEEDMQRIMRTRIIAQTGHTPEEAIDQLLGTRGIGLSESIIALIIIVAAAATLAILGALINAVTKVIVAEYAVPENIEDGCPEETDWPDSDETKQKLLKFGAKLKKLSTVFFSPRLILSICLLPTALFPSCPDPIGAPSIIRTFCSVSTLKRWW